MDVVVAPVLGPDTQRARSVLPLIPSTAVGRFGAGRSVAGRVGVFRRGRKHNCPARHRTAAGTQLQYPETESSSVRGDPEVLQNDLVLRAVQERVAYLGSRVKMLLDNLNAGQLIMQSPNVATSSAQERIRRLRKYPRVRQRFVSPTARGGQGVERGYRW